MSNTHWVPARLGDEVDLLTGYPFQSKDYSDSQDSIRLLRGDNVVQGKLRWDGVKRWPRSGASEVASYQLAAGDVVLAMDRPWIEAGLKYAAISTEDLPCLLVQRVARFRGGPHLDTGFLRYLIGSKEFTDHVLAVQTGTAVPHISGGQIKSFKFLRPPKATQRRIAEVLGSLDDKIEFNRRMNETLEATARTLFRSWFVDFDPVRAKGGRRHPSGLDFATAALFPDSFEDSPIGPIPKGWRTVNLYETARYINGAAFKNENFCDRSIGMPVIKIAELKDGITSQTKYSQKELGPDQQIDTGDMLYSWSGSPDTSLDIFRWAGEKGLLNQHIFNVHTRTTHEAVFVYYLFKHLRPVLVEIARNKQTTGLGHVTVADMKRLLLPYPPESILTAFYACTGGLFNLSFRNNLQAKTLAAIRDSLLPKLLSGELRVPQAEHLIEVI